MLGEYNSARKFEMAAEGLIGGKAVCRQCRKYPERSTGLELALDDLGIPLAADGSDFVPVRATVVDNKGVPKVLASEYVHFTIEGPGQIIGDEFNHANPTKTEFGTATALVRASVQRGTIRVRAMAEGQPPAEGLLIQSTEPGLPLLYDPAYASSAHVAQLPSKPLAPTHTSPPNATTQQLEQEIQRLKFELTSRDQTIMDLRSKID